MDMLDDMIKKQKKLQERLWGSDPEGDQAFISLMVLACIDELMEALHETAWKPWKTQLIYDKEAFKREMADVWHFIINLTIASGMDSKELYEKFCDKNKINHARKKEGY